MNHYQINQSSTELTPPSKDLLRVIALAVIIGADFCATEKNIHFKSRKSLDNLRVGNLVKTLRSSKHTATVENFDKPITEKGDLVCCIVQDKDIGEVTQYYNDYIALPFIYSDAFTVLVGVSNATKTEIDTPFSRATLFLSFDMTKIEQLTKNI